MSAFVCLSAARWLFEDEATPETDAVLRRLEVDRGWSREYGVWSSVTYLRKRNEGNVSSRRRSRRSCVLWNDCRSLSMRKWMIRTLERMLALARAEELTTHEAAYLATRRGAELATLDKELIRAARRSGVATLPA